jgi:hypothetical protein
MLLLDRFSVQTKLYFLLAVALLGVVAMAGAGLWAQHRTGQAARELMDREWARPAPHWATSAASRRTCS